MAFIVHQWTRFTAPLTGLEAVEEFAMHRKGVIQRGAIFGLEFVAITGVSDGTNEISVPGDLIVTLCLRPRHHF